MKENKTLEFIWKGRGFGAEEGIMTHVHDQHYSFPYFLNPYGEYDTSSMCYHVPVQPEDYENW